MSLLKSSGLYKPFEYEWAYKAWHMQQVSHWMPEEVSLADDVQDWKKKLKDHERNLLTHVFRFFTQLDIEVGNNYNRQYAAVFCPTEICMMLTAFANMETIHVAAYSYLLDTIGMPESTYQAFLEYKEMKDKYDYLQEFKCDTKENIAIALAVFGAFTEGLQLFAVFAILLNFQRFGKMKGMGQIIAWVARDETLHTLSIIRLFNEFIRENPELWTDSLKHRLTEICREIVRQEFAFIDLAFEMGDMEGLTVKEIKQYVMYIANRRLIQIGLKPIYDAPSNSLPWMDVILNGVEFTNFFENRVTEYSKSSTEGTWDEAFSLIQLVVSI